MPNSSNIEEQQNEPKPKDDASTTSPTTPKRNNSLASTILPEYNETQATAPPSYKTATKQPQSAGPSTRRRQQPVTNPPSQTHTASCGNPASTVMAVMGDAHPSRSEAPQVKRKFTDRLRDVFGDDLWGTKPGDPSFHLSRDRGEAGAGTTSGHWNVQGVRLSDYGGFGRSGVKK